jgi:uncharacterized cupredoxin-like copper-binding protein
MKIAKIMPIAILFLIVSVTIVSATHTSTVTMTPSSWAKNTDKSVSLAVTNNGPDAITKIELLVPKDANQVPLYIVGDITKPEGWTYTTTGSPVSKIAWIATGSGIASGSSLNLFGIDVKSPSSSGDYKWTWTTNDSKATYTGTITTTVGKAPVSYFVISGVPTTSTAGNSFKFNVKAYGDDNQIKTDYTGTISFTSTDANAGLPSDYTFQLSDSGSKDFLITYKTVGEQTFTVKDSSAGISKESAKTSVKPGAATEIGITPEDKKVSTGEKVEFKVSAKDVLGNSFDLTDKTTLTIDKKAGGNWNKSVYTTENEGTWIVIASYGSLVSGTTLTVGKVTVVTPTQEINITPTVPEEVPEISLTIPESITIAPGANDTVIVTVNNNGNKDLTGVEVKIEGIPSDWISIYPLLNDIPAKSSKDYLVIISVPANESESKTLEFTAKSGEITTSKNTTLTISSAPTSFFALPKNLLQLGVVIIAVAAVVIIGWELWFKKPKSK